MWSRLGQEAKIVQEACKESPRQAELQKLKLDKWLRCWSQHFWSSTSLPALKAFLVSPEDFLCLTSMQQCWGKSVSCWTRQCFPEQFRSSSSSKSVTGQAWGSSPAHGVVGVEVATQTQVFVNSHEIRNLQPRQQLQNRKAASSNGLPEGLLVRAPPEHNLNSQPLPMKKVSPYWQHSSTPQLPSTEPASYLTQACIWSKFSSSSSCPTPSFLYFLEWWRPQHLGWTQPFSSTKKPNPLHQFQVVSMI